MARLVKTLPFLMELPRLRITTKPASLFEYRFEDFEILNYAPAPAIKALVAV